MKNFIKRGFTLRCIAPYALVSGQFFKVGSIIAVAMANAAISTDVVGEHQGVFDGVKATGEAWAVGDKIYWNDTNKNLTTTASGATLCGCAAEAAGTGATVGRVYLDGCIR